MCSLSFPFLESHVEKSAWRWFSIFLFTQTIEYKSRLSLAFVCSFYCHEQIFATLTFTEHLKTKSSSIHDNQTINWMLREWALYPYHYAILINSLWRSLGAHRCRKESGDLRCDTKHNFSVSELFVFSLSLLFTFDFKFIGKNLSLIFFRIFRDVCQEIAREISEKLYHKAFSFM